MERNREQLLDALMQIVCSRPNDAVALALAPKDAHVGSLDLWCVSELTVNSAGTVEVKFVDRLKAIGLLLDSTGGGEDGMNALLAAMDAAGE